MAMLRGITTATSVARTMEGNAMKCAVVRRNLLSRLSICERVQRCHQFGQEARLADVAHVDLNRRIIALATVCAVAASNVFAANVDPLVQTGLQLADGAEQKVLEWSRHIHASPELSWQEAETARYIAQIRSCSSGEPVH